MNIADMITALFADPILSRLAIYQPQGSSSFALRVVARQPDALIGFGDGQIHTATSLFEVQARDVAQPVIGDQLTVDGVTYIVQSEPTADSDRLIWTLNVRPE